MKSAVFFDIMLCSLIGVHKNFGGTYCFLLAYFFLYLLFDPEDGASVCTLMYVTWKCSWTDPLDDLCNGKTILIYFIRSYRIYELAMEGTELAKYTYLIDLVEMQKVKLTREWSPLKVSEYLIVMNIEIMVFWV
jgi:hypothetical protein